MQIKYPYLLKPYPRVKLHPATVKHMHKGHPWVTADSFTAEFPTNKTFLIGTDLKNGHENCVIIHDPGHKTVKARIWDLTPPYVEKIKNFPQDLQGRLHDAFTQRKIMKIAEERDNYYLVFGEADRIPGVMIIKFGNRILIQIYAGFWKKMEALLLKKIGIVLKDFFPDEKFSTWVERRNENKESSFRKVTVPGIRNDASSDPNFVISEFGVNYNLKFDNTYDHGLYTDMSSIRKKLRPYFESSKKVLNLYSYTGAFSLFALKNGAEEVASVDLSPKYLDWLQSNLDINEDLNDDKHTLINMPSKDALTELIKENYSYDLIICDPPSASSDGKRVSSIIDTYKQQIPLMMKLLSENGNLVIFKNTHKITKKKFENAILEMIKPLKGKITLQLKTGEDCKALSQFPEGNYLQGLVITKN